MVTCPILVRPSDLFSVWVTRLLLRTRTFIKNRKWWKSSCKVLLCLNKICRLVFWTVNKLDFVRFLILNSNRGVRGNPAGVLFPPDRLPLNASFVSHIWFGNEPPASLKASSSSTPHVPSVHLPGAFNCHDSSTINSHSLLCNYLKTSKVQRIRSTWRIKPEATVHNIKTQH